MDGLLHYGLQNYGFDIGASATPQSMGALATYPTGFASSGPAFAVGAGTDIATPFGGANVEGRISTSILAAALIGLGVFYWRTKGIQF